MLGLDPLYLIMMVPVLLFSFYASFMTKHLFKKYAKVRAYSGYTGAQAAKRMMEASGVFDVGIERTRGMLSDHYDPTKKVLRLSEEVYDGHSLSAVGVACHEAGHALQHAQGYAPLGLRTALVPVASFGSSAAYFIFIAGWLFGLTQLMYVAIAVFFAAFLFTVVTLPVEYNASSRAKEHIVAAGIVSPDQAKDAGAVLNAAFLTYLAAAAAAFVTLLYYIMRASRR